MNTLFTYPAPLHTWFILLAVSLTIVSVPENANAQRASFIPKSFYIGFETTGSTRSFTINSDLSNQKGRIQQSGQAYGLVFGSRLISGKIKLGSFSSTGNENNPTKSSTIELGSNLSILQMITGTPHLIEPYVTTAFESTSIKSSGMYTPHISVTNSAGSGSSGNGISGSGSSCDTSGMPANPDAVPSPSATEPAASPAPYSGNYGTARLNMGVGIKIHLSKGNHFINFFSEMKYGISLGTTSSTQALQNTYSLGQSVFEFGAAIGFIHNKGNFRARKLRFR